MKKKISWRDQLINLLVVIIGISAAFQLDNWREGRKQRRNEKVYLENLINELDIDLNELDTLVEFQKIEIRALRNVKDLSDNIDHKHQLMSFLN